MTLKSKPTQVPWRLQKLCGISLSLFFFSTDFAALTVLSIVWFVLILQMSWKCWDVISTALVIH